jgi:hypothetical protein
MPNLSLRLLCVLVTAVLAVGCGDESAPPPARATAAAATPTATATSTPAFTAADDLAACSQLERLVQAVSLVVGHTTEDITKALHPKELAEKIGTAQQSLLDSAKVVEIAKVPSALARSQHDFAQGLRMFAADFGRAKATTRRGDMDTATRQLTDEAALHKIQVAAKKIDDLCGG